MLADVKAYIDSMPYEDFSSYYQNYVIQMQNKVATYRLNIDKHRFNSIDNITVIVDGLNNMVEELTLI